MSLPVADVAPSMQVDLERARQDIAKVESEFLSVRLDGAYRVVTARCPQCGERTEIHQTQPPGGGDWAPDFGQAVARFGWQHDGEHLFCSHMCRSRRARQNANFKGPMAPVLRVNDASYAKRFYASAESQPKKR